MFGSDKFYWGIAIFLAAIFILAIIELVAPGTVIPPL